MSDLKIRNEKDYPTFKFQFWQIPKQRRFFVDGITYLLVLLFGYTAAGKLITINTFQRVLLRYPLIADFNIILSYLVPVSELFICVLLIVPATRRLGLLCSLCLMTIFLVYILYMFVSNSSLPCSCGGFVSKLSWQQHIWFNSVLIVLAALGLKLYKK